jgi:aminoglycoside/choline kinase family phosphotransferase
MQIEQSIYSSIQSLIKENVQQIVTSVEVLPGAGSNRQYYRVFTQNHSYIVCNGNNPDENSSFIYLCNHFKKLHLHVPNIYGSTPDFTMYILEDLGSTDLLTYKLHHSEEQWMPLYTKAIEDLTKFQCVGIHNIDFTQCYARPEFDAVYMQWDLAYFKYYYCKLTSLEINEQKLEKDFSTLISFLLQAPRSYFMYRDFQSRNIMVHNNSLWYIDFQGGMKGPLHYDIVSLLYQAKAQFSEEQKNILLDYYIQYVSQYTNINITQFKELFRGFVFIRILQTLGAYGYRGIIQKKQHFIESIPQAVYNAQHECEKIAQILHIPYLQSIIKNLPILTI